MSILRKLAGFETKNDKKDANMGNGIVTFVKTLIIICVLAVPVYFVVTGRTEIIKSEPKSKSSYSNKTDSEVIYTGDEVIIDNETEFVLLGRTKDDFAELQKISLAQDTFGLAQMMEAGRIFEVKRGTKAKLLDSETNLFDYNSDKRQVRILEGLQIGKSGWVNYDFVKNDTRSQIIKTVSKNEKQKNEDEISYMDEARSINNDASYAYNYLVQILTDKPRLIYWTETDRTMVALNTVALEQAHDRAIKLNAPEKYFEMHNLFLKGLQKYKQAMPIFRQGLDSSDRKKLSQTTKLMNEGADTMKQIADVMYK
ncbi:hypothetical protein KAR28_05425 [Candidatus Parcubacteria bacterium]|nr:hypothetical protein [Candidatus Parcubacteria bacterium]